MGANLPGTHAKLAEAALNVHNALPAARMRSDQAN